MTGIKKKERSGMNEAEKNSKKLLSAVMVAVVVSSVLMASMPLAAADITSSFAISPCRGNVSAVSAYNVTINTTGFTSLDMTIPAGFEAKAPEGGELLAEVWVYNDSKEYYMRFTANGTDKIDMCCACGGDTVEYTFDASYGQGDSINISVSCGGTAYANLTLPTGTVNGSLNMSLASIVVTNVKISIKEFVKNPTTCGSYAFDVTANGYSDSFIVCIMYPGDISGPSGICDNKVNLWDLVALADAYLSEPGDANWDQCADMNCDGVVDIWDLIILGDNYLKVYP